MDLRNTHALVTGGGRRVGKAIALALAKAGARVTVHAHESAAQAREWIAQAPTPCRVDTADLRSTTETQALVDRAAAAFGPVGVLISSASAFFATPASQTTEEEWNWLLDLNLRAPFFLAARCAPAMQKAGEGCIIHICDIHASAPLKRFAPYCASKGGLWTLTRSLAAEWAPAIRVNSVSPGTVLVPDHFSAQQTEREASRAPLGLGTPEDVAAAVLFLIGNAYVTGFDLKVSGGL